MFMFRPRPDAPRRLIDAIAIAFAGQPPCSPWRTIRHFAKSRIVTMHWDALRGGGWVTDLRYNASHQLRGDFVGKQATSFRQADARTMVLEQAFFAQAGDETAAFG